jgi:NADPH-dependent 2,4-dienoyl-CoA reductase/sulfur reductase-like enzyme
MPISRRNFIKLASAGAALASIPPLASAGDQDPVVVVGGGYAGATVAKYLRLWSAGAGATPVPVTLIDPNAAHVSCIMSNLVLNARLSYAQLALPLARLRDLYGVKLMQGKVVEILPGNRQVRVESVTAAGVVTSALVAYSRLVVATGIEFDKVPGWDPEVMPHAWVAGPQTLKLRDQLNAMPASGTFVMTIPPSPYRCPPGPYERACVVADVLKRRGGKPKVVVLDANPEIQAEKGTFTRAFSTLYAGIVDYRPNAAVGSVEYAKDPLTGKERRTVVTSSGQRVTGDVVNVIAPHRAAKILADAKLTGGGLWAPVDPRTYASTVFTTVHIIGDAQGTGQPKSGHMANSQAKVCADAILRLRLGGRIDTAERLNNLTTNSACYSPVNASEASFLTASFRYDNDAASPTYRQMKRVWLGEAEKWTTDNYKEMFAWASNLMTDSFA